MSDPVTIEDIYALFQRSQEEADRRFAKADQRAAESKAEFERSVAESRAEFERSMAESRAEFDRRMTESKAEADKRLAKAEAIATQANQAVNSLSSRWGRFVENIVAPAALRLFQSQGMAVQEVYQRVRSARGNLNLEIDILVVDDDVAVVIEVKSRLTQDSIRQVLRSLEQFKLAFPHYAGYRLYGAVAAIEIDKDVDTYAYNQGLFVIQQSGDSVEISNTSDFTPRNW
ncbi:DUF3782 domain-containing protein [Leptothoe spongobia]|uniref:DUF3782 domain-containing protein n=1 Tax=Leptothoe spongobia TAU-MAC 1115 TaxID=1967444 RepID=A0A947DHF5_9CYAN|nr:DUF3782 domain-containing protein [Leptothoe spongobia]MBT9316729.1 DUF3782 domain-containing protein [Leptothoe spongobia TAU-MAC 1115]